MVEQQNALRRGIWWGLLTALGLWAGRQTLLPAPIRNARLSELSGTTPAYATLVWTYGQGARPISIIFDIDLAGGATGSITTDGEALEAEVPLIGAPGRDGYQLTVSATYRILGVTRTLVSRFRG